MSMGLDLQNLSFTEPLSMRLELEKRKKIKSYDLNPIENMQEIMLSRNIS